MIAWIVDIIAASFNFVPTTIWLILFGVGTFFFWIGGEGFFGFTKVVLLFVVAYAFLCVVAWLFPTWLENIAVVAIVILFWWGLRS